MNTSETSPVVAFPTQVTPIQSIFRPARPTHADRVLTLETAERGVTLHVGESFSINFGEKPWNIRILDELVLGSDGAGGFQALAGGKTQVYITSDPPNNSGPPGGRAKLFVAIPVVVICN